ncbi:hypothetical protein BN2475_40089 [Paraburkholderia ribeironis]|uniref:Uncharacterized protein n=1 Tax=Paraburkholderia ribeironis TaxID=1247936 RepID=A0A1N7RJL0_9BURK|nr:hypothetical protein BN2475_40089 [Paraburkholderia ribeironis]
MTIDSSLTLYRAEALPGQRYPLPAGWNPDERCSVFFVLTARGPELYPFVSVGDIAGVQLLRAGPQCGFHRVHGYEVRERHLAVLGHRRFKPH